jgi:hypothetical protein
MWNAVDSPGQRTVAHTASPIIGAAVSGDGMRTAVVLENRTLEVRDTQTGSVIAAFASYAPYTGRAAALSPDGRYIAAILDVFTPIVWDVESRRVVSAFTGHRGEVLAVCFSGVGQRVATGSWDNTARIWDAQTAAELIVLEGHTDSVTSVAFNPDSTRVATGSADNTARIWDTATGHELLVLTGHDGGVSDVTFNADGSLLATASGDGMVRVWDAATGANQLVLEGHGSTVLDVHFSADARRLATASEDGRIKLWDGSTGSEVFSIERRAGFVLAAFLPARTTILSASGDATVRRWDAVPWTSDLPPVPGGAAKDRGLPEETPGELTVATTRHAIVVALSRLAEALAAQPVQGAIAVDGPVYHALARLCLLPGDQLMAIAGVVLTAPTDVPAVLREQIERVEAGSRSSLSFNVVRKGTAVKLTCVEVPRGTAVKLTCVEVPRAELRREVAIPTAHLVELIEAHRKELAEDGHIDLKTNQQLAAELGEPSATPDGLNGIWLKHVPDPEEKAYHLQIGLAPGDRMVSIQDKAITSLAVLEEVYQEAIEQLKQGTDVPFSISIERGAFQQITLETP